MRIEFATGRLGALLLALLLSTTAAANTAAGTNNPIPISGTWRIWNEHGGNNVFVQGKAIAAAQTSNPDHVFEIHPITEVNGIDIRVSYQPIPGYDAKEPEDAFPRYDNVRSKIILKTGKITIVSNGIGYNYVNCQMVLNEKPFRISDGALAMARIQDSEGHLLLRARRMVFVKDTAPEVAVRELGADACLKLLGIPRVDLALVSWRVKNRKDERDSLNWNLPYEIIVVGVYPEPCEEHRIRESTNALSLDACASHAQALSAELLALAAGQDRLATSKKVVFFGCGSLGSKLGTYLGRSGFGNLAFVDKESLSPHNLARHALVEPPSALLPPNKAEQMRRMFESLTHASARAFADDVVRVLDTPDRFAEVVPQDTALIVDTTASLQVLAAASTSRLLSGHAARLVRAALYARGRCAVLALEGPNRVVRVDDLAALVFEHCRSSPGLRAAIAGDRTDPTRIFVGDNCRSLTMPMSDAMVSRAAAPMAILLERWLTTGVPDSARLCIGIEDPSGLGMLWAGIEEPPATAMTVHDDSGWEVRVLSDVASAIDREARHWGRLETGGALIGRVSHECRTITIAGLVAAPADSVREETKFVLGTEGLVPALRQAHQDSLGHLMFLGTWHSHPTGGPHSGLDRRTLKEIAKLGQGLPMLSLVWTPQGLRCVVDRS